MLDQPGEPIEGGYHAVRPRRIEPVVSGVDGAVRVEIEWDVCIHELLLPAVELTAGALARELVSGTCLDRLYSGIGRVTSKLQEPASQSQKRAGNSAHQERVAKTANLPLGTLVDPDGMLKQWARPTRDDDLRMRYRSAPHSFTARWSRNHGAVVVDALWPPYTFGLFLDHAAEVWTALFRSVLSSFDLTGEAQAAATVGGVPRDVAMKNLADALKGKTTFKPLPTRGETLLTAAIGGME